MTKQANGTTLPVAELRINDVIIRKGRLVKRGKEDYWQELIMIVPQSMGSSEITAFKYKQEDLIEEFRVS